MLRVLIVLALFATAMLASCVQPAEEDPGPNTLGTIDVVDETAAPADEAAPADAVEPPAEGGEEMPPAEGGDEAMPPAEGGEDEGGAEEGGDEEATE